MKEWRWLGDNPMTKVSKPADGKGRNRLLTLEEKDRLLEACKTSPNPYLYPIVSLALLTGMRFGEIATLKWENIDFVNKLITLEQTKNGERRVRFSPPPIRWILLVSNHGMKRLTHLCEQVFTI